MRAVVAEAYTNATPNYLHAEFPMDERLIGIRGRIHQNYISLSALYMNFYAGHSGKDLFPPRRNPRVLWK